MTTSVSKTQIVFNENGNIYIYPCSFEENPHMVLNGDRAIQKGRILTNADGTTIVLGCRRLTSCTDRKAKEDVEKQDLSEK